MLHRIVRLSRKSLCAGFKTRCFTTGIRFTTPSVKHVSDVSITKENPVWNKDGLLTKQEAERLAAYVKELQKSKAKHVGIAVIRNFNDLTREDKSQRGLFARQLHQSVDSNVLITYFHEQRGIEVHVDETTAAVFTDDINARIRDDVMVPQFKEGHIYSGLWNGVQKMSPYLKTKETTSKVPTEQPQTTTQDKNKIKSSWWSDFKAWNRAMWRGERSLHATALYGAGVAMGAYYLWEGMKWCFWLGLGLYVSWRVWKRIRAKYFPQEKKPQPVVQEPPLPAPRPEVPKPPLPTPVPLPKPVASGHVISGPKPVLSTPVAIANTPVMSGQPMRQEDCDHTRIRQQARMDFPDMGFWRQPHEPITPGFHETTKSTEQQVKEPTKVPPVMKAAAVGAGAALVKKDFEEFRRENARTNLTTTATSGSSWDASSSSTQNPTRGSSWDASSSGRSSSSSRGSSWDSYSSGRSSSSSRGSSSSWGGVVLDGVRAVAAAAEVVAAVGNFFFFSHRTFFSF